VSAQIALLRAVNVGGRKVVMSELRAACDEAGFANVRTLLASGNLVLGAKLKGAKLEAKLEAVIADALGLATDVFVRDGAEMDAVIAGNPFKAFAKKDPSHLLVAFLLEAPSAADKKAIETPQAGPEEARVIGREIYITYPSGIGRSKFKLPLKAPCTTRNLNTVTKLAEMARGD
jgi:uncharacterized protein (DUF1697 family)